MKSHPDNHPENAHSGVISASTLMPVGIIGTVVMSAIAFVWWLGDKFGNIDHRLERIESRMVDNMARSEMEAWALRLARDNPNLKVPDIR
jgi:hypothetical protein